MKSVLILGAKSDIAIETSKIYAREGWNLILAGRNINEKMGSFFGNILIKEMNKMNIQVKNSNAVIMGFAFKENCSDIRNTKVIDIIKFLTHKKV